MINFFRCIVLFLIMLNPAFGQGVPNSGIGVPNSPPATPSGPLPFTPSVIFNVADYGAKSNEVRAVDGTITGGANSFCSPSTTFSQADVGKTIILVASGTALADQSGTIASFVSQHCVTTSFNAVQTTPWQGLLAVQSIGTSQSGSGSYAPLDTLTVVGGTSVTTAAVVTIYTTQLVSATVNAVGSGGTTGACTLTGTTGTAATGRTRFSIAATIAGGAISALGSVTVAGDYTANPSNLGAEPVTSNCELTGATLVVKMGVLNALVTTQGQYGAFPSSPASTTTIGSGTGATVNLYTQNFGGIFAYGTDDTVAVNNTIAAAQVANGGTVVFPVGSTLMTGAMVLTNSGATNPVQSPVRLTGAGGAMSGYEQQRGCRVSGCGSITNYGSFVDMRYAGSGSQVAKIDTRGAGILQIDNLTLMDGGTSNYLMVFTTNTTLFVDRVTFTGNPTCYNTTCAQSLIQLGTIGAPTSFWTNLATAPFQGYGTYVNNSYFDHCAIAVLFGASANTLYFGNDTVSVSSGSSDLVKGAPYQFYGNGLGSLGNTFVGGAVDLQGYTYMAYLTGNSTNNTFIGVALEDEVMGSPTIGVSYFDTNAIQNGVVAGYIDPVLNNVVINGPGTFNGVVNVGGGNTILPNGLVVKGNASWTAAGLGVATGALPTKTFQVGAGAGQIIANINGGSSGTAGGSAVTFSYNNTTTPRGGVGGFSALLGGSYDSRTMLYGFDGLIFDTNNVTVGNVDTGGHWLFGTVTSPTIASGACGTGTNGTLSGTSNDQSGTIIIGAATTTSCAVTFGVAWGASPRACTTTPASAASAGLTILPYISALGTTGFTLSGAVLASTSFYYHCY